LILLGSEPYWDSINKDSKINILVLNGKFDEVTNASRVFKAFENITGIENPIVGKIYGSFYENNARELYLADLSDHLTVLYSIDGVRQIVNWVDQFYHIRDLRFSNDTRLAIYILIAIVAYIAIFPILSNIREKLKIEEKPLEKKSTFVIAVLLYIGVSGLTSVFALFMQIPFILVMPLFVSTFILGFFYTQVFALYITFYIHKRITKENYKELFSKYFLRDKIVLRVIYSLIISAIVYLLYYLIFQNFFNVELNIFRVGFAVLTAILLIPYIVFNELFFRGFLGSLGNGRLFDILFPILIRLAGFFVFYFN